MPANGTLLSLHLTLHGIARRALLELRAQDSALPSPLAFYDIATFTLCGALRSALCSS